MEEAGYKKLIVWKKADDLAYQIYMETKGFPKEEIYGITSHYENLAIYKKALDLVCAGKLSSFTPLEKAAEFIRRSLPYKADGGLMPPSAYTVRERSSLTGFTIAFWGRGVA